MRVPSYIFNRCVFVKDVAECDIVMERIGDQAGYTLPPSDDIEAIRDWLVTNMQAIYDGDLHPVLTHAQVKELSNG